MPTRATTLIACLVVGLAAGGSAVAPAQTLATGLQGYWRFEGDGSDESGNSRTLSLVGSPGFGAGLFGQSLSLTGNTSQHALQSVNDTTFDVGGSDFTIQVWVNYNTTSGEQVLFEKFSNQTGPGYTFTKVGGNFYQFYGNGLTISSINTPVQSIATGIWHHLIARRAGDGFTIFLDGSSIASLNDPGTITSSTNALLLGMRASGPLYPLNGRLDEVAFWNRALSNLEVTQLYNGGTGLSPLPEPTQTWTMAAGLMFAVTASRRRKRRSGSCPPAKAHRVG